MLFLAAFMRTEQGRILTDSFLEEVSIYSCRLIQYGAQTSVNGTWMVAGRLAASMHMIHPEEIMARQEARATAAANVARETDSEVNKTMLARKVLIERRKEEHERAREEAEKEEEQKKRAEQVRRSPPASMSLVFQRQPCSSCGENARGFWSLGEHLANMGAAHNPCCSPSHAPNSFGVLAVFFLWTRVLFNNVSYMLLSNVWCLLDGSAGCKGGRGERAARGGGPQARGGAADARVRRGGGGGSPQDDA